MNEADPATRERMTTFFTEYAEAATAADVDTIEASYDDTYIEASPTVAAACETGEEYSKALREKYKALNGQMGFQGATIDVDNVYDLAPNHLLVATSWTMRFAPEGRDEAVAEFGQTYLVRSLDGTNKIICYVSHSDEQEMMERLSLIPSG